MTVAISVGVASHSSAAHPAVLNRILSSDNAARKQTVPEEFICGTVAEVLSTLHGQDVQVILKNRGNAQCCWNSVLAFKKIPLT